MREPIGRIEVTHGGGALVVHVLGEVDLTNAKALEAQIAGAVRDAPTVVLDLSGVAYLDSAGLALIYRLGRSLDGGLSIVASEGALVRRTLDVAGIEASPGVSSPSR